MDRVNVRHDEDLMLAAGQGDLDAFERIVVRYQGEAWRVAYRFTGDAAEAEDLAQDAFLKMLDAAGRYRPTATFRTYFYRVLTRVCIAHRRKKRPVLANPLITAKHEEIRAGQQRMQELVVEHLLAEKQVLTTEQQKELFDLIRQRSACHGPGRMMGLPGSDSFPGSQKNQPQE